MPVAVYCVIPVSRSPERSRGGAGAPAEATRDQREAICLSAQGNRGEELLGLHRIGSYEDLVGRRH